MENLVLVTIDSLRADHVGCYGYERNTTPFLDSYASQGHRFSRTFAHACATRPSFPAIMTSTYPLMYGGFEQISKKRTLISEVLSDNGYTTGGFHSNLYLSADFGYGRGFDTFFDSKSDSSFTAQLRQSVKNKLDKSGVLYRLLSEVYDQTERTAGVNIGTYYVSAEEITNKALEWVAKQTRERPVFLWVHYMDPHHPYAPPVEYQEHFDTHVDQRQAIQLRRRMLEEGIKFPHSDLEKIIDLYDSEIRYTDEQVNRLLNGLNEHWDEWTGIITADHGEEFLDHGNFAHPNTFYDEVIHVPLIVYDQGRTTGLHDDIIGLLDIAPTLATKAGVTELPENFYGYPLEPFLSQNSRESWRRTAVRGGWCTIPEGERRLAYRDDHWKYIRDDVEGNEELYNIEQDPDETENLVESSSSPTVLETLRTQLRTYERDIEKTTTDVEAIKLDHTVRQRLQNLGYQE